MTAQDFHDFIQHHPLPVEYGRFSYRSGAIPFGKLFFAVFPIRLAFLFYLLLTGIERIIVLRITYPSMRIHPLHVRFYISCYAVFQVGEQEIGRCECL